MDKRMSTLPLHITGSLLALVIVALCLLIPNAAHAGNIYDETYNQSQYEYGVDWDSETGGGTGSAVTSGVNDLDLESGGFACLAGGASTGTLFVNEQCNMGRGAFGVFANVVCRVENVFATMLGLVYCAVSNAILDPLLALFVLYVTVYGAMVILGMVPQTFAEATVRILKIGAVATIALNADVAIGVGYKFFISMTQVTIQIVFDIFTPDFVENNSAMANMIQGGYMNSPNNPDMSRRLYVGDNWMMNLEYTTHRIFGFFMNGGIGFLIVMALLFIFAPPVFFMLCYLLISLIKTMATAVVGYLLALLGITFLFTVSPIFVSFALFRTTSGYFDAWLRNLFSYTMQIMVIFVFLMFTVMIDIVSFFQSVGSMVRHYEYVFNFGWFFSPFNIFTTCKPERDGAQGMYGEIVYYKFAIDGTNSDEVGNIYEGFPRCIPKYDLMEILSGNMGYRGGSFAGEPYPPGLTQEQIDDIVEAMDGIRAGTIEIPRGGEDMPAGLEIVDQIIRKANEDLYYSFTEMVADVELMSFFMVRMLVIIVLTFLLNRFMGKIPHMASQLAGTGFAGRLGGGEHEPGDAPGVQGDTRDFGGLDTGFAKFKEAAFASGDHYPRGFIRSAPARFAAGMAAGVGGMGRGMMRRSLSRAGSLGLSADVRREMMEDQSILESKREGLFAPTRSGIGRYDGVYHPGGRPGRPRGGLGGPRRSRRGI